ncbi:aspartate/glutamate racemase family protein [Telmatospirillum siberiense]|uniref:Asp/Glu/hydantoin racemase n=1 Tax=Telmatospirillum siberiense TaxID=382514 RepID=A0A2N3Q0F0_9PROT|nr:aspartate/glutamate racemase family protein [Telmatospirillum siberiense]PKU26130.1 Asp/Glu/hydantoin racemase [Telmatospirillum siberiense]
MSQRTLIGMLTPSSNTVLEPVTSAILSGLENVSAHFGRFRVTEISLRDQALGQFDEKPIVEAAQLLADAKVQVIAWNGTSSGWLGFEADRALCRTITAATGIPATTSVLALNEILERTGVTDLGLVTPYLHDVQERIVANYAGVGVRCRAERHLNDPGNFSFSEVPAETLKSMVREVAAEGPQAITTFCTNLRAAPLVAELEEETGIPIYDTISVVVWKALAMTGVAPAKVKGWGRLFDLPG